MKNDQDLPVRVPGSLGTTSPVNLEEVLQKLRSLQEVLFKRFQTEKEIEELPSALASKTESLNRRKQGYLDKNDLYNEIRDNTRTLRDSAIQAEHQREQYESQMDEISTQREYEALDKEIRNSGDLEVEVRRELQREEEHLGEMAILIEKEEGLIAKVDKEVTDERARIEGEVAAQETLLQELLEEEKKITPGLDAELLFKFERIIRSKEGLGIVPLRSGICTGCHIILPPFFTNRVRSGEEIIFCPNCSRIVFYGGEEEFESDAYESTAGEFDGDDLMFDDEMIEDITSEDVTSEDTK